MAPRPPRAAATANQGAPLPVRTVEEDPLAAEDADEVDEDGEPVVYSDSDGISDDERDEEQNAGDAVMDRVDVEEEPDRDAPYGVLPEDYPQSRGAVQVVLLPSHW